MSNTDFDPFHLDSGVKENFDGIVSDAWFGEHDTVPDTLFLWVKILADDGEEVERRYSCGDGWKTFDGGQTAEHPTRKYFQNNSNLGVLLTRAFANGGEQALRQRNQTLNDLGPRAAALWKGFRAHWDVERESFKVKDRDSGELVERERVLIVPMSFISMTDGEVAGQTAAAISGQSTPQTTQVQEQVPPPQGEAAMNSTPVPAFATVNAAMQQLIRSKAKELDYASWIDAVMGLPGVIENDILMTGISDEAFYNQLRAH